MARCCPGLGVHPGAGAAPGACAWARPRPHLLRERPRPHREPATTSSPSSTRNSSPPAEVQSRMARMPRRRGTQSGHACRRTTSCARQLIDAADRRARAAHLRARQRPAGRRRRTRPRRGQRGRAEPDDDGAAARAAACARASTTRAFATTCATSCSPSACASAKCRVASASPTPRSTPFSTSAGRRAACRRVQHRADPGDRARGREPQPKPRSGGPAPKPRAARVKAGEAFEAVAREVSEDRNRAAGRRVRACARRERLPDVFVDDGAQSQAGRSGARGCCAPAPAFTCSSWSNKREAGAFTIQQTRARHILLRPSAQLSQEAAVRRLATMQAADRTAVPAASSSSRATTPKTAVRRRAAISAGPRPACSCRSSRKR